MSDYKDFDEGKIKHLELIQDIIKRMATNSFYVKGWCATLYSALLVFFLKDFKGLGVISLLLLIPAFFFMVLDAYYLSIERSYRDKYKLVLSGECEPFDLGLPEVSKCDSFTRFLKSLVSPSVLLYYLPFVLFSVVLILYIIEGYSCETPNATPANTSPEQ